MTDEYRLVGMKRLSNLESSRILNNRMLFNRQNGVLLLSELILAFNCLIGDYFIFDSMTIIGFVNQKTGMSERLVRAIMDNSSHSLIGMLSWFIASYPSRVDLNEMLASGFLASIIDLDHFVSAKSIRLVDAVSLSNRPFMHNSLSLLLANSVAFLAAFYAAPNRVRVCWLVFVAWFSHHVRDANRRGLWFGFLGSTRPLSDAFYMGIVLALPLLVRFVLVDSGVGGSLRNYSLLNDTNLKRDVHVV